MYRDMDINFQYCDMLIVVFQFTFHCTIINCSASYKVCLTTSTEVILEDKVSLGYPMSRAII